MLGEDVLPATSVAFFIAHEEVQVVNQTMKQAALGRRFYYGRSSTTVVTPDRGPGIAKPGSAGHCC